MTIYKNQVAELRKAKNIGQIELAKKINVSNAHLCKIEKHTKPLTLRTAMDIAQVLGVTLNDIFLINDCSN